jgi:ABC-type antimicrobial peptide transport system permease subunit
MNDLTIIFFVLLGFYVGVFFGMLVSWAIRKMKEDELDSFKDARRYNNISDN